MATPGPEPLVAQSAASPPPGHNVGNGGPALPNSRGLERALEEATFSGALNLSARKLKEFPRTAAGLDLSDTVEADLSKNRLSDVPSEVCHLVALESLNLYHNCIRSIPDAVISLHSLTSLNLSRNQLSALPACLCALPLRVLNASNNKLVSLPESVGQLRRLMELDISCNELTTLPRHIGRLRALRELNVRRNLLCVLPEDLADLPLVKLDFSCNKVSTIPLGYRRMAQLQALRLENNPLQSPPAQICLKGKVHIFKYLSMEASRGDKLADALYLPAMERLGLMRVDDMTEQQRKRDSDSGVGSDIGEKRLSATEPSDEDGLSVNAPMSHITEEDGLAKDDSGERVGSPTDPGSEAARRMEGSPAEAPGERPARRDPAAAAVGFVGYGKASPPPEKGEAGPDDDDGGGGGGGGLGRAVEDRRRRALDIRVKGDGRRRRAALGRHRAAERSGGAAAGSRQNPLGAGGHVRRATVPRGNGPSGAGRQRARQRRRRRRRRRRHRTEATAPFSGQTSHSGRRPVWTETSLSVPTQPQECGVRGPAVHHEEEDGAAEGRAGADGAAPRQHREPAEVGASRRPGHLADGRRGALPLGQSHSPALGDQHPRALARRAQTQHGQVSAQRGELPGRLSEDRRARGQVVPAAAHPGGERPAQGRRRGAGPAGAQDRRRTRTWTGTGTVHVTAPPPPATTENANFGSRSLLTLSLQLKKSTRPPPRTEFELETVLASL